MFFSLTKSNIEKASLRFFSTSSADWQDAACFIQVPILIPQATEFSNHVSLGYEGLRPLINKRNFQNSYFIYSSSDWLYGDVFVIRFCFVTRVQNISQKVVFWFS